VFLSNSYSQTACRLLDSDTQLLTPLRRAGPSPGRSVLRTGVFILCELFPSGRRDGSPVPKYAICGLVWQLAGRTEHHSEATRDRRMVLTLIMAVLMILCRWCRGSFSENFYNRTPPEGHSSLSVGLSHGTGLLPTPATGNLPGPVMTRRPAENQAHPSPALSPFSFPVFFRFDSKTRRDTPYHTIPREREWFPCEPLPSFGFP
jgi:hypothetical protein